MTRTPDEIKKGLECCARVGCCHACPYDEECHSSHDDACPMHMDALALIQQKEQENAEQAERIRQLEAQNAELLKKVEQLEAERDAAVRDCGCFPCQTCEERENGDLCPMCEINGGYRKFHQWRGLQKEE